MQVFRSGWFLFVCVAVLVVANVRVYKAILVPRALEVSMLDAGDGKGKGNAVLVRAPSGAALLVDAGPDAGVLRALGLALPPWQRRIDAVILTGTKVSSVGGLSDVGKRYRVPTIARVGDAATPYGTSFAFGSSRITIIAPATFAVSYEAASINISSSTPAGTYASDGRTFIKTK